MGAIPNKLPGFQDIETDAGRARAVRGARGACRSSRSTAGTSRRCSRRWSAASSRAAYVIGENPAYSEADDQHATPAAREPGLPDRAGHLHDEDGGARRRGVPGLRTRRFESEGTVTNSERRVQRVRKALDPPGNAQGRHLDHRAAREAARRRLGRGHARTTRGRSCARSRPMHAGMSLRAPRGAGRHPVAVSRRVAPRHAVPARPPVGVRRPRGAGDEGAVLRGDRRAAGRRAGRGVPAPADHRVAGWTRTTPACRPGATRRRCGAAETIDVSPEDAERLGLAEGERVLRRRRVAARSRRRSTSTRACGPAWSS